jgi:hypothetical protein
MTTSRLIPLLLVLCVTGCASTTTNAPVTPQTREVTITPIDTDGNLAGRLTVSQTERKAECTPGSFVVARAYRCMAGDGIYDPCWAAHHTSPSELFCLLAPWDRTVIEVHSTGPLEAVAEDSDPNFLWGLELATGQRCLALQGPADEIAGRRLAYGCGKGLYVLANIDRSHRPWRAWTAREKDGFAQGSGTLNVTMAWVGIA